MRKITLAAIMAMTTPMTAFAATQLCQSALTCPDGQTLSCSWVDSCQAEVCICSGTTTPGGGDGTGGGTLSLPCKTGYYCKAVQDDLLKTYLCVACPDGGTTTTRELYETTCNAKTASLSPVSDCYIPGGTSFSDDIGSGTYTDDCHY